MNRRGSMAATSKKTYHKVHALSTIILVSVRMDSQSVERIADYAFGNFKKEKSKAKAGIGKFYRPTKKPVTTRLDTDIIARLKSYGRGYQTKTNMQLRHAMKSSVRTKRTAKR
jgi:uncharacterized protein (DUF4415 family)